MRTFTHVEDLALALCELAIDFVPGILHAGPEHGESHYTFARAVARAWPVPVHLLRPHRIPFADVEEREIRLDTRLDTSFLRSRLKPRSVEQAFPLVAGRCDHPPSP